MSFKNGCPFYAGRPFGRATDAQMLETFASAAPAKPASGFIDLPRGAVSGMAIASTTNAKAATPAAVMNAALYPRSGHDLLSQSNTLVTSSVSVERACPLFHASARVPS